MLVASINQTLRVGPERQEGGREEARGEKHQKSLPDLTAAAAAAASVTAAIAKWTLSPSNQPLMRLVQGK